ncbi:mediator of RNA polymerase II transcription subunit 15a-like, partial [Solanum dulcamara]|uniref:mediator of RNA polymerase II transcription subunit 15a-like n=1 Tax=Solanum dulcamara TaxID=45834 RepID=UPI002486A2F7
DGWEYLTAAQTQGGGEGAAGAAAGDSDSGDWRTHFLPESRRRIAIKIMETLKRHAPVHVQDRGQKVMEIAVKFEEKMYNAAKSQDDYLKKISLKMLKMETNYQNPLTNSLHPNTASSGLNAHGQEMTMEATSYEATSGPEDSDKEAMEEEDGNVSKEDVVEEVVVRKEQTLLLGTEVMSELGKMSRNLAPTKLLGGLQYFSIKRTPLDSSTQMGNANGADRQEELYQKIKSMKEMYLSELNDIYQKISSKVQQKGICLGQKLRWMGII